VVEEKANEYRTRNFLLGALAAMICLQAPLARAAAYPERTITLSSVRTGGPTDIIARILSESLSQSLKQSVVVENKPGAAGNVGMGQVARPSPTATRCCWRRPDCSQSALFEKLPYDPFKDFAPISNWWMHPISSWYAPTPA